MDSWLGMQKWIHCKRSWEIVDREVWAEVRADLAWRTYQVSSIISRSLQTHMFVIWCHHPTITSLYSATWDCVLVCPAHDALKAIDWYIYTSVISWACPSPQWWRDGSRPYYNTCVYVRTVLASLLQSAFVQLRNCVPARVQQNGPWEGVVSKGIRVCIFICLHFTLSAD